MIYLRNNKPKLNTSNTTIPSKTRKRRSPRTSTNCLVNKRMNLKLKTCLNWCTIFCSLNSCCWYSTHLRWNTPPRRRMATEALGGYVKTRLKKQRGAPRSSQDQSYFYNILIQTNNPKFSQTFSFHKRLQLVLFFTFSINLKSIPFTFFLKICCNLIILFPISLHHSIIS